MSQIYVLYVDDIFIATYFQGEINKLIQNLEKNSEFQFTELNINKRFPSLVVSSDSSNKFITSLFKKSTSHNSTFFNYHTKYEIALIKINLLLELITNPRRRQ